MIICPLVDEDFVQVGVIDRAFLLKSGAEVWENVRDQVAGQTRRCSPDQRGSCSSRSQPAAAPSSDKLWFQSDAENQPEWRKSDNNRYYGQWKGFTSEPVGERKDNDSVTWALE